MREAKFPPNATLEGSFALEELLSDRCICICDFTTGRLHDA